MYFLYTPSYTPLFAGGPDMERWKCNRTELETRGLLHTTTTTANTNTNKHTSTTTTTTTTTFSSTATANTNAKIDLQLSICCEDIYRNNKLGTSERIHYRHLKSNHIPIALARFPVYLTRRRSDTTCYSECFRIFKYHYKEYIYMLNTSIYPYFTESKWPDVR